MSFIYGESQQPSFYRDFASNGTLNHGIGPDITFTRNSIATYFDQNGILQTAAANVPRFDYDPVTLQPRGLLVEESRTNFLPNSQLIGAVPGSAGTQPNNWSITGAGNGLTRTISTGVINNFNFIDINFNGIVTGGPILLGFDPQAFTSGYAASNGETWVGSAYFALIAGNIPATTNLELITRGRQSDNSGSNDETSTVITTLNTSLQRFTAVRTFTQATTTKVTLDIRINNIPNSSTVNFTLRIAAPQLERGSTSGGFGGFATSFIPTTNAAATRGAEDIIVTPINTFYNQNGGTLYAEGNTQTSLLLPGLVSIDDGTSSNRIQIRRNDTSSKGFFTIITGNTLQGIGLSPANWTNGTVSQKIAVAYGTNDQAASQNGSAVLTNTTVTLPASLTRMVLGRTTTGDTYLNGCLRKIGYWVTRLSNFNLQQLTK